MGGPWTWQRRLPLGRRGPVHGCPAYHGGVRRLHGWLVLAALTAGGSKQLLSYVSGLNGVTAANITRFAQEFATTKPARIIEGAGTNHYYHNDLINRAQILLVALTGNVGKNGGGFNHYVGQERVWPEHGFKMLAFPEGGKKQRFQNTTLWTYCHSKMKDPHETEGRPIEHYIAEAVKKGWMPLWPKQPSAAISPDAPSPCTLAGNSTTASRPVQRRYRCRIGSEIV